MPRLGLLVVALAAALAVGACGVKPEPTGALPAFPTGAVDATGREVVLAAAPERIVVADPGAANVLREIAAEGSIAEVELGALPDAAADPAVGLVIVPLGVDPATVPGEGPVYVYGAADVREAPSAIAQLGLLVGRGPAGAAVAERVARGLDALRDRTSREGAVRTLIVDGAFEGRGPETQIGRTIAAAGGENVLASSGALELDEIAALDVRAWVALEPNGTPYQRLATLPELRDVPAIRDGRVLPVPAEGYPIDGSLPAALEALADDLRAPAVSAG